MPASFPNEWLIEPPRILVVGNGCYAASLALVLGAGRIGGEVLSESLGDEIGATTPQVLSELEMVFLVSDASQTAAGILSMHRGVWERVERLSPEGDEHRLAVVFVLPRHGESLQASLALGLGLEEIDPETSGHAVAVMSDPLASLLAVASRTVPCDAVVLRNRLLADKRHAALHGLKMAEPGDPAAQRSAATEVLEVFREREYDLDLFCRPPCHPNGNAVRGTLCHAVTQTVTPDEWKELLAKLS